MQGLRERGKQRRRDDLLVAARALVVEGGAEALTMRALADRAEVSVPTIYGLIGGRDAVIVAMLERGGEQFTEALGEEAADPVARIHHAIDVFCAGLETNQQVARELARASAPFAEAPGSARHRLRVVWSDALADAQRLGVLDRTATAGELAAHLDALVLGAATQWAGSSAAVPALAVRLHHAAAMVLAAHARADSRDPLRRACDRAARAVRDQEPLVP